MITSKIIVTFLLLVLLIYLLVEWSMLLVKLFRKKPKPYEWGRSNVDKSTKLRNRHSR